MADFCRQCSISNWAIDYHDYPQNRPAREGGYAQICEGCGFIKVDHLGNCISTKADGCLLDHGSKTPPPKRNNYSA